MFLSSCASLPYNYSPAACDYQAVIAFNCQEVKFIKKTIEKIAFSIEEITPDEADLIFLAANQYCNEFEGGD